MSVVDGISSSDRNQTEDWIGKLGAIGHSLAWCCSRHRSTIFYCVIFGALSYLMISPLWSIRYLPLGDLPDHAGQIRAIMDFEYYQEQYYINWFTPYLLAYLLTMFFALFMPVAFAVKVVLSLCLLTFPIAAAMLLKQLKGDRVWVISAFPVGYSFSFFWGFYSCVVGSAVAMFFLVFMVAYAKRDLTFKWYLLAVGLSLLLFFAHVIPWGFAACAAPLILFIYNDFKTSLKKLTAVYAIVPVVAYWMSITGGGGGPGVAPGHYLEHFIGKIFQELNYFIDMFNKRTADNEHQLRLRELFSFAIGRPPLWDYIVLSAYLIVWPLLFNARLTFDYRRWLPLILVISLYMLTPYYVFESFYVYYRFGVFLIPVIYFLYDFRTQKPIEERSNGENLFKVSTVLGALICSVLLLKGNVTIFESFKENDRDFSAVLAEMEMDKNMMFLVFDHESKLQFSPPYLHFGGWYQTEKRGSYVFSFSHDPISHSVPLRYKGEPWPSPSSWNMAEFSWHKHQGDRFDYFLVRSKVPRSDLFIEARGNVVLLAQHGMWYLYGKKEYLH